MQLGDHLFVHKSLFSRGQHYTHHGVYIGNHQVIHYAGYANGFSGGGSQKVERISLKAFSGGQTVHIRHHPNRPFERTETVRRAFSRLGEDSYNLLSNNCEHFATWCCIGESSSEQVKTAIKSSVKGGGVLASGSLLLTTAGRRALKTAADVVGKAASRTGQTALQTPYVTIGVAAAAAAGAGYWAVKKRYS